MSAFGNEQLWALLASRHLVEGECPARSETRAPWFVRVMLGIAGWMGACFLLGFVALGFAFVIDSASASFATGALVCAGAALLLRKRADSDFMSQFGFAVSLAGQALMVWGWAAWFDHSRTSVALAATVQQAVLFVVIPGFLHRVWCAGSATGALVYALGPLGLAPYAPACVAAVFSWIWLTELKRPELGTLRRAAGYGLALALALVVIGSEGRFVVLFGGWGSVAPGSHVGVLSAGLVGLVLLLTAVALHVREGVALGSGRGTGALLAAGMLAFATLWAPGLAPALLILVLGFANGNRMLAGFGILVLLAYLSYYYYDLQATLLEKSVLLAATGTLLLLVRLVLVKWAWPQETSRA